MEQGGGNKYGRQVAAFIYFHRLTLRAAFSYA
jgi:hypothetical protein